MVLDRGMNGVYDERIDTYKLGGGGVYFGHINQKKKKKTDSFRYS